jgi:hypothetical protein
LEEEEECIACSAALSAETFEVVLEVGEELEGEAAVDGCEWVWEGAGEGARDGLPLPKAPGAGSGRVGVAGEEPLLPLPPALPTANAGPAPGREEGE